MDSTIEIDFDVYKELTARRPAADVSYNDVLRELLGLKPVGKPARHPAPATARPWVIKGIRFPDGTELRARYKGREYMAVVREGAMLYDGVRYKAPSAAAIAITGNNVNGWRFWEARRPGETKWRFMIEIWRKEKGTGDA
jgi:hypothetical protein